MTKRAHFSGNLPPPPLPAPNPPPSAAPSNRVTDKTMNNENWLHILCEIVSSKLDFFFRFFFSVWLGQSSIILRLNSRMKSEIKRHAGQIRASIGLYPKANVFTDEKRNQTSGWADQGILRVIPQSKCFHG